MKVHLHTVEFHEDKRGPGAPNQCKHSRTFSTMEVKSGQKEQTPTGLSIIWDQEAGAVFLRQAGAERDPVVIYGWHSVNRAIPLHAEKATEGK